MKISYLALAASLIATPAFAESRGPDDSDTSRANDIVVTATPDRQQATVMIDRIAGAVEIVPDSAFRNTPVQNIKDILSYGSGGHRSTAHGR